MVALDQAEEVQNPLLSTLPGISDGDAVNLVTWSSDTVLDSGDDKVNENDDDTMTIP